MFDRLNAERKKGSSIEVTSWEFTSPKRTYKVMTVPGDRDYFSKTVFGITQGMCSILAVSAAEGEFESGVAKTGRTPEHALLALRFGLDQIIIAVTKMDHPTVNYSEDRFEFIKGKILAFLLKVGYKQESIQFVPVSGLAGDNITEESENMKWAPKTLL